LTAALASGRAAGLGALTWLQTGKKLSLATVRPTSNEQH
ncbi:hypothetical protein SAMN05421863_11651, partial [Nitrosomonas communis]